MDASHEISCSVAETNRIRLSLGLKPLQEGPGEAAAEADAHRLRTRPQHDVDDVRGRIRHAKEQRLLDAKFQGKKLAEDDEDHDDVERWVKRSRNGPKRVQDERKERMEPHPSGLEGVAIRGLNHEWNEGDQAVLTLKDRGVLDEDEDELELAEKVQELAKQKAKRKARPHDPLADALEQGRKPSLLDKYDEEEEEEFVRIGSGGIVDARHIKPADRDTMREKLAALTPVSTETGTEPLPKLADASGDFYTAEEAATFLKPKKKKKRKLRKNRAELGLEEENLQRESEHRAKPAGEGMEPIQKSNARAGSATGKATEMDLGGDVDSEEDDAELQLSLARARRAAFSKEASARRGDDAVLEAIRSRKQKPGTAVQNGEGGGLVLNEVEEFVAGIHVDGQNAQEGGGSQGSLDAGKNKSTEDRDTERMDVDTAETGMVPPKEEPEIPVSSLLANEQHIGKGMAGALAMLKQKGELKPGMNWSGRTNDKKAVVREGLDPVGTSAHSGVPEVNITYKDEFGRVLTPKEAFRELCYNFHGIRPSKNKREKRLKQYLEEIKEKQQLSMAGQEIARGKDSSKPSQKAKDPPAAKPTSIGKHEKVQFSLGVKRKPDASVFGADKSDKRLKRSEQE